MARSSVAPYADHSARLTNMTPAAKLVRLGTVLDDLISQFNAVLAKLDADNGVSATTFVSGNRVKPLSER
jgi:hypothetical protein